MTKLTQTEGFEPIVAQRLCKVGIETLDDLLAVGCTVEERKALATQINVTFRTITRWITVADLARVNGVHVKYASLLQSAGIKSVQDLAQANPHTLHAQIESVNRFGRKQVSRVPAVSRLEFWIEQAKMTSVKMECGVPTLVPQL
jgi:predicted flap endonuclease-1-like 5' DNA nuclease